MAETGKVSWAKMEKNKGRRHVLTRAMTGELRGTHPGLLQEIEAAIGEDGTRDVYDRVMEAVNSFSTQRRMGRNADVLIDSLVELTQITRRQAAAISGSIRVTCEAQLDRLNRRRRKRA